MTPAEFRKTDTFKIVEAMKATGNRAGIIAQWKGTVSEWAEAPAQARNPDAAAVRSWLPHWQARPFYTVDELAPLWPMLAIAVGARDRIPGPARSAARLRHELDHAGLPVVQCAGTGSMFRDPITGIPHRYYAVERLHFYRVHGITQAEFHAEFSR